jgi:hypothetical protein
MTSPCAYALEPCPYPAHVVLFGNPNAPTMNYEFAGTTLRRGQLVAYCLKHGGDIYDAIHGRNTAKWLASLPGHNPLPVVRLADHITPEQHPRPRPEPARREIPAASGADPTPGRRRRQWRQPSAS